MTRILPLAALVALLSGCSTLDHIMIQGACRVPEKLDYEAAGPAPLPSADTPLKQHLKDDAAERGAHKTLAGDYNALRGHVKGCGK